MFRFAVGGAPLGVEGTYPRVLDIPCRAVWGSVVLRKVLCRSKARVSASGQVFCVCGSKAPTHTLLLALRLLVTLLLEMSLLHPWRMRWGPAWGGKVVDLLRAQNSERATGWVLAVVHAGGITTRALERRSLDFIGVCWCPLRLGKGEVVSSILTGSTRKSP